MTTSDILLTRAELESLTGAQRPSTMCAWLSSRNWIFEMPARQGDFPKVARAYFDARMTGALLPGTKRTGPRLDFLMGAA